MATKLTKKQRVFVKEYAQTGNGTQAALQAYDTNSPDVAKVIASENLTKPNVQKALEEALPQETLYEIHREGLFASKPFFNETGDKIAEEADYAIRHKYLDTAYKLKGSYAPDRSVSVNVDVETSSVIKELTDKLNELYRRTGLTSDGGAARVVGHKEQD